MQMLGCSLIDPQGLEGLTSQNATNNLAGLNLLPLHTVFEQDKALRQREVISNWPDTTKVIGFELHHGISQPINDDDKTLQPIANDPSLGWVKKHEDLGNVAGTYLHGIFDNGSWRRHWLNMLRQRKKLTPLPITYPHHGEQKEQLLDRLADAFEQHVDISPLLEA